MTNKGFIALAITGIVVCSTACQANPPLDALAANAIGYLVDISELKEYPAVATDHKITITRNAKTKAEEQAIRVAEAYPADRVVTFDDIDGIKNPVEIHSKDWWQGEEHGTKVPYAITKEAIDYYTELTKSYQTKPVKSITTPHTEFTYEATAKAHNEDFLARDGKKYSKVWGVDMKLYYFHKGGETDQDLFTIFSLERQVILDYRFKVLSVYGDGKLLPIVLG